MPKIVVKRKAEVYKEFSIRPFQSRITIGSEGDNDLIIADKKVSLHHLVIEKEGTHYYVRDNHSAFGSFLNGERIADRAPLLSGDEIKLGDHSLIFENVLFEKSIFEDTQSDSVKTIAKVDVSTDQSLPVSAFETEHNEVDLDELPVEERTKPSPPTTQKSTSENLVPHYLLSIYGPYLGKKYRLNFGVTKIGRDNTLNDIVIRENSQGEVDSSVSRRHATVFMEAGNYFIMDKRSKTRTRVNRQQLGEEDVVQLFPNDEIEIVSDQKSTIFRFVPEALMNFSPPKKAGFWWIRNSVRVVPVVSTIISILLMLLLMNSWGKLRVINQQPSVLQLTEKPFISEQNISNIPLQPGESVSIMPGLAPAVADFDGDGNLDIAYVDRIGYVKVMNGKTLKPLWNKLSLYRVQLPLGMVIADLNNNKLPDILIPSNNSIIYAIDGKTGTEIWSSPLLGGIFSGNPVIADLNGDGLRDIFICSQTGQIHIGYGGFANPDWSTLHVEDEIRCTPSASDMDNDGLPEVIVGTEYGKVLIFDGTKNNFTQIININEEFKKAKGSFFEDHPIRQRIAIGKLNSDDYADFVVLTEQNHILAMDGKEFKRLWFDELESETLGSSLAPPTLADLNADGQLDVVLVTSDNTIIAYDGTGKEGGQKKINWGYIPENREQFVSYPVLVDINKDKNVDVLVAGFYGGLYIFNGRDGKLLKGYTAINHIEEAIIATPLVADLNRDKKLDILLRKNNDSFVILQTNSQVEYSSVLWGQINFDALQAGCNSLQKRSGAKLYLAIFLSIILLVIIIGYNIYGPLKRRNLFLKTP
jgi:pSer/pThr/pTyr-binding forkhead associated (FHA) protein/outer membrane protein assembly factor BamB